MGGVREHVQDPCLNHPVPQDVDQPIRITRQSTGITRNIADTLDTQARQPVENLQGATARRVQQGLVVILPQPGLRGEVTVEIGGLEAHVRDPVAPGIGRGA